MPDNFLFYIIFLSQIILASYYFPRKIYSRINYILNTYPPSEYPKLYPKHASNFKLVQVIFRLVNQIIFVLGFIIMFLVGKWDYSSDGNISVVLPVICFMVQMIPIIAIEISEFVNFKLMRIFDTRTIRKAELHPRKLFDYISPLLFGLAVFLYFASILFFYSIHQFQFHVSNDTFLIIITQTVTNSIYAGIIFWNLYGKKVNPYQAAKDRIMHIEGIVKSSAFISIAVSLFLMIMEVVDNFNLDYLEPSIMSLYLQIILLMGLGFMLRIQRIENMDFEVYKEDASAQKV